MTKKKTVKLSEIQKKSIERMDKSKSKSLETNEKIDKC